MGDVTQFDNSDLIRNIIKDFLSPIGKLVSIFNPNRKPKMLNEINPPPNVPDENTFMKRIKYKVRTRLSSKGAEKDQKQREVKKRE